MDLTRLRSTQENLAKDLGFAHTSELKSLIDKYWPEGRAWAIELSGKVIGYGRVDRVPGLSGVYDLNGFITESNRQKGCGSFLLQAILDELQSLNGRQLTYADDSQNSLGYVFLQSRGFELEHVESTYELQLGAMELSSEPLPAGFSIATLGETQAAEQFIKLYDSCFAGLPWYQAYDRAEVLGMLENPANLLFLQMDSTAIGFCWIHHHAAGWGEIEPLGLAPHFRNQGFGRHLLRSALRRLVELGTARVQIGAWRENEAAIRLYTGSGFRHSADRFFLAFDL